MVGHNILYDAIYAQRDPSKVEGLSRFFKTGPGQYGEGDIFLGIKVPTTRNVVKELWKKVTFEDLEECISSKYHEVRLSALLCLVRIYKSARKDEAMKKACVDFYLSHTQFINNWDLVDLSCYEILGAWLLDKDRSILYDLARNGKTIWERRIGIVSTMAFNRKEELDDTYAIADIFLDGKPLHDLLQKAVGWLLRDAGDSDMDRLAQWLEPRCSSMPRTMLRYSIEKFPEPQRKHFLNSRNNRMENIVY